MNRRKYSIIHIDRLEDVLKEISQRHSEIMFCYLYGSYIQDYKTEFSDIDVGIFLDEKFEKPHLYSIDLCLEIEEKFNHEIEIDLCILNKATPRFLFNIIKYGKVLHVRDELFHHEYEIRVLYDYFDIKPMLDMYDNLLISEALKHEGK